MPQADELHTRLTNASGRKVSDPKLPSVLDLFAGCGGMSLGFQLSGFNILEGFDNWKQAVDTYNANFDHAATLLDLNDTEVAIKALEKYASLHPFPAIIGGPPCQDFSPAGSRVEGVRAGLTEKFAAVVSYFEPPFFVMENVARAERAEAFKCSVARMSEAGYIIEKTVLDASLCGVPQRRKRLITIGTKIPDLTSAIFEWLRLKQGEKPMTVREWFGDRLGTQTYYRHPRSYTKRGIFSIDEPSPTIRGVNRPIPPGYPGHRGDAGCAFDTRPLTTAERAEIQTFPSDYVFTAPKTATEQMIGNAVPVKLAQFVAGAIASSLLGTPVDKNGSSILY